MNLAAKFRETAISVVPVMLIVFVLNFTVAPLGSELMMQFFIGGILLIIGLSVFLIGADIGLLPIGQKAGAALTSKRNLPLMLSVAFAIGVMITIAEPDVQVLANQVATVDSSMSKTLLVLMIATGVGLFVALGLARIVFQIPLRRLLIGAYAVVFVCAYFTSAEFLGIAFDSGGATTGPMTVPFILALGAGVAAVRGGKNAEDDSFGLTGLASIGPILAVLILGIMARGKTPAAETEMSAMAGEAAAGLMVFVHLLPEVLHEVFNALWPLTVMFLVFQFTLIHMPPHQFVKMIKGLVYTFFGLVFFLVGVKGGFMPAGTALGAALGGTGRGFLLIPIGLILGAVVVCAEPAVWVLNDQVETVSGGHIRRMVMLASLSMGVAVSVALSMIRVITGISLWWFLIPGYAAALILTKFCPPLFTAIAFDSGGVASGPMSSTFVLSFALGASAATGGNPVTDAFGVIAMVAMTPLIAIQILGLIYKKKEKKAAALHSIAAAPAEAVPVSAKDGE